MTCASWPPLEETNIPSYVQIYDIIFQMIQSGELSDGDQLPGENLLAAHWNVSRSTVRTAVRKLEEDGFLYKAQGKRTMVANRTRQLNNGLQWLFNPCVKNCISPITTIRVSSNLQQCGRYVADKLGYSVEASVMAAIDAAYYAEDRLVASSVLMVHSNLLEKWNILLQDEERLRELVSSQIYQHAVRSGMELTAMSLDEEEGELPGGRNVIVIEEVITGENDEPIAYFKHWLNANWYRFSMDRKPLQLC
ncbi:MAG: GntR family transcriptional regulator [Oscillibacter sp.]|nr:GntR family transcriptional regulator [Oscillibacter sp.]